MVTNNKTRINNSVRNMKRLLDEMNNNKATQKDQTRLIIQIEHLVGVIENVLKRKIVNEQKMLQNVQSQSMTGGKKSKTVKRKATKKKKVKRKPTKKKKVKGGSGVISDMSGLRSVKDPRCVNH